MRNLKLIHESPHSLIYLEKPEQKDQQALILKVARNTLEADKQLQYLQREYIYTQKLSEVQGVRKVLRETTFEGQYALELIYIPGEDLRHAYVLQNRSVAEVLRLCISIAHVLQQVHNQQITHKDLNSSNILIGTDEQVYLIDFALAAFQDENVLLAENPGLWAEEIELAGSWAYMAPEQTGRMNQPIDARTDLYALGVNMYEMLTGQLPLKGEDSVSWVHAHMAQQPVSPQKINQELPLPVAEVVMTLLEKAPGNRYPDAGTLIEDLQTCLKHLDSNPGKTPLALQKNLLARKPFQVSNRLYGRAEPVQYLKSLFQKVTGGATELVMIRGESGTGMTRLVHEMRPFVQSESSGYFLEGKFDQLNRNRPYSAWLEAFERFLDEILTEPPSRLENWKTTIQQALGNNGRLLTQVFPRLELIVGTQPEIPEVGLQEAQNRFRMVFRNFIDALSEKSFPLFIFLDDWQWADSASLELLKTLMSDADNDYFLIAGTFRKPEVGPKHPLSQTLETIVAEGKDVHYLELSNLSQIEVAQLIADTLACDADICRDLTSAIFAKTHGNPFFIHQMLHSLYEKHLIERVPAKGEKKPSWEINLTAIKQLNISDNVVEFVTQKIQGLSGAQQKILQVGACAGDTFSLEVIQHITRFSSQDLKMRLSRLTEENILLDQGSGIYKFAHNRIRRVCYRLIPPEEIPYIHLQLGTWMLNQLSREEQKEEIFDICNHLNHGAQIVQKKIWSSRSSLTIHDLARLNLMAAQKATDAAAFPLALDYIEKGARQLEPDCWKTDYELSFDIYFSWAEIAYMNGDIPTSTQIIKTALSNTETSLDEAFLHNLLLIQYNVTGQYRKAFFTGKKALRRLGFSLHEEESQALLLAKHERIKHILRAVSADELLDLPLVINKNIAFAVKLLANVEYATYHGFSSEVWSLSVLKMVFLCLRYGHVPEAAYAYATYGRYLIMEEGQIEEGFKFGDLALRLSARMHNPGQHSKVCAQTGGYLYHWKKPLSQTNHILDQGYLSGMESGEWQFASLNLLMKLFNHFEQGNPLPSIQKEVDTHATFAKDMANAKILHSLKLLDWMIHTLTGSLTPQEGNQQISVLLKACMEHQLMDLRTIFHLFQAGWYYWEENYGQGWQHIQQAASLKDHINGRPESVQLVFWESLLMIARENLGDEKPSPDQQKLLSNLERLKGWAANCPENFLHKYQLVQAEYAYLKGEYWQAANLFDKAILNARKQQRLQDEALINTRTGKFWINQGKQEFARPYFLKAHYLCKKWGAKACVGLLERQYPHLLGSSPKGNTTDVANIDTITLMKASQTLSGEIVISNLLDKLMQIVITHAGAEKGALLTREEKWMTLEAIGSVDMGIEVIRESLEKHPRRLPATIIHYVARTHKELVLADAFRQAPYAKDPYIKNGKVHAVVCFPILSKGQLKAILYLENNLASGIFTSNRLEILRILSGQIAISLENASLYENLEEKVKERTHALNQKNEQLSDTLTQLKNTQKQLVDSAKMASLGQLTAGIAHEINNPINFVSANVAPLKQDIDDIKAIYLDVLTLAELSGKQLAEKTATIIQKMEEQDLLFIFEEMDQLLEGIREGAQRTKGIVDGLSIFSRGGNENYRWVDLHEGIDSTLMLLNNKIKGRIDIVKKYGELPQIECLPGKINQVLMNILNNAIFAIEEKIAQAPESEALIEIKTEIPNGDYAAQIHIRDTGIGMPPSVCDRVFEPFFTTRDVGKGTGLGLSISFGIIEQHGGVISVESEEGVGTTFSILLPQHQHGKAL